MADVYEDEVSGNPVVLPVISETTAVTVSGSWNTNVIYTAFETRIGSWAEYEVKILCTGAPNAANLTINLPTGRTIDTSKLSNATSDNGILGLVSILDQAVAGYVGRVFYNSTTSVGLMTENAASTYVIPPRINATTPMTFGSGDWVTARFRVPILEWAGSANVAYGAGLATSVKAGLVSNAIAPTNLVSTDLTSQTNLTIEPADVNYFKYSMVNNKVSIELSLNTVTVTGGSSVLSFTLPASVPRPIIDTSAICSIYDASPSVGVLGGVAVTPTGVVTMAKLAGGTFTGGANNSYFRAQITYSVV